MSFIYIQRLEAVHGGAARGARAITNEKYIAQRGDDLQFCTLMIAIIITTTTMMTPPSASFAADAHERCKSMTI